MKKIIKKSDLKIALGSLIKEVISEMDVSGERICKICDSPMGCLSESDFENKHGHCNDSNCKGQCEKCSDLEEVTTTGNVAGFLTKNAFGKVRDRVARQAGYTPVNESVLREEDDESGDDSSGLNVKKEYDKYVGELSASKSKFEARLNKLLSGKKVTVRAKKSVKTTIYIKNYDIDVASVELDDHDIVIKGGDGKNYYLDKNWTIVIHEPAPKEKPEQAPEEEPAAEEPAAEEPAAEEPAAEETPAEGEEGETNLSKEINK